MAVPTLSGVTPARGHTGGTNLVEITGTNFRLPTIPSSGYVGTPEHSTVEVLFGTKVAVRAAAATATLIRAIAPIHDPGEVGVTVRNLDDDGVPIPGEEATLAASYTFERPALSSNAELVQTSSENVARSLRAELARQIIEEVVISNQHTDWTDAPDDTLRVVRIAKLPALVLEGPRSEIDRLFRHVDEARVRHSDTDVRIRRVPKVESLTFDIVGITDSTTLALRLRDAVVAFFARNVWLYVPRYPNDVSSSEMVQHELDMTAPPSFSGDAAPASNLRTFTATCVVRGVETGPLPGFEDDFLVGRTTTVEDYPEIEFAAIPESE